MSPSTNGRLLIQTRIGWAAHGADDVDDVGGNFIKLYIDAENVEEAVSQILDEVESLLHNQPSEGFELISRAQR